MEDTRHEQSTIRILQARYTAREDFLKDVAETLAKPTVIYYPTKIPLAVAEQVIVEVIFPGLPNRALLRGRVSSLEFDPPGARIEVSPEDVETIGFLLQAARGEITPAESTGRRYYRLPLEIPVDWQVIGSGDATLSSTEDLSGGGVQIRTPSPAPMGSDVVIVLALDERKEQHLRVPGKVAWVKQDEHWSGMGVRFAPESAEERKTLRDLIRKFMERGEIRPDK
jgi:Tfp pilus assembly protein PilZ